jgi:hypothetical protein
VRDDYRQWLEKQGYGTGTVTAQLHRVGRVEEHYGSLDDHFDKDQIISLGETLKYSSEDQRQGRANPTTIPINGDLRNNLASYRSALEFYKRFLRDESREEATPSGDVVSDKIRILEVEADVDSQRIGLERDLQTALRRNIADLEQGLSIIDRGAERAVPSGRVDITALDRSGAVVVIELKAGIAGRNAVGQILSYMGDVATMETERPVRGILVAAGFDSKALASARVVPTLALKTYSVRFTINDADKAV